MIPPPWQAASGKRRRRPRQPSWGQASDDRREDNSTFCSRGLRCFDELIYWSGRQNLCPDRRPCELITVLALTQYMYSEFTAQACQVGGTDSVSSRKSPIGLFD
jgi:hypothetical protein